MDAFWEFVNRRSVRYVLAAFCILLAIQGIYGIVIAQNGWDLFRGVGEIVLWGSWALVNLLRANGRVMTKLNIVVNIGIVMLLISWFAAR